MDAINNQHNYIIVNSNICIKIKPTIHSHITYFLYLLYKILMTNSTNFQYF